MASNQNHVIDLYGDGAYEDQRAAQSRADNMEFYYTKRCIEPYITADSIVAEIGCATGYYAMHFADKCKQYHGVDIVPGNIEVLQRKIRDRKLKNVSAEVGDATDLRALGDDHFDIVLVLGPMYHLPKEERELVMRESKRICKPGGIIVFAYINKTGAYVQACLDWKEIYPNRKGNEYVLRKGTDDQRPDVFYFTMPEEMAQTAALFELEVLRNVGVDFTFNAEYINSMPEDQFEAWMEISDLMCGSESCTGLSNHALLVCRKPV